MTDAQFVSVKSNTTFHGTVTSVKKKESQSGFVYYVANIAVDSVDNKSGESVDKRHRVYVQASFNLPKARDDGSLPFDWLLALNRGNLVEISMPAWKWHEMDESENDGVAESTMFIYPCNSDGKPIYYQAGLNHEWGRGFKILSNPVNLTDEVKFTENAGSQAQTSFDSGADEYDF